MKYEQKVIYQILLSIQEKQYVKNYELNISPMEFYVLIMDLVDQELIINIPDPEYKNNQIVFFDIEGAILTIKGKEKLDEYLLEEKIMNNEIFIVHGHDEALSPCKIKSPDGHARSPDLRSSSVRTVEKRVSGLLRGKK